MRIAPILFFFLAVQGQKLLTPFPSLPGQVMSGKMNIPHTQQWQEQFFCPVSFREDDISPLCLPVRTVCTTWVYSNCSSTHHCRSNCYTPVTGENVPDSVSAGTGLMWLWPALWGLLFWAIFAPRRTTENAYRVFSKSSDLVRSLPLGDLGPGEALKPRLLLLLPQFRPDFQMPEATTTL